MRLIDSDKFLQDMAELYRQAGWDEREVHFSLADLRSNIGMEDTILIPQREADVVPVIRCRDCKYAKKIYFKNLPCFKLWEYSCQYFNQSVIGDGYCYLAERKTDNARNQNGDS